MHGDRGSGLAWQLKQTKLKSHVWMAPAAAALGALIWELYFLSAGQL
jgi:hypothetical protein